MGVGPLLLDVGRSAYRRGLWPCGSRLSYGRGPRCGALLMSTVLLRIRGRTATATVPFAILWMLALAYSVNGIRAFRGKEFGHYCGNVELCIPDFDLFVGAVPMAVAVSLSAVGSVVIDRKRCSARRDAGGGRPRADHPRIN